MAPEECDIAHPPSARTRAVWLTAARLTAPWPCKGPLELSLYRRPNVCSSLCGRRDLPVTQWAPGVKSVAWCSSVIDFNRASNLSLGPASGNSLYHRNAKSILRATNYFEPTPLAYPTRAQANVTRSATPVMQVCASNRDASAALCCLTGVPLKHNNWRVLRLKRKLCVEPESLPQHLTRSGLWNNLSLAAD